MKRRHFCLNQILTKPIETRLGLDVVFVPEVMVEQEEAVGKGPIWHWCHLTLIRLPLAGSHLTASYIVELGLVHASLVSVRLVEYVHVLDLEAGAAFGCFCKKQRISSKITNKN